MKSPIKELALFNFADITAIYHVHSESGRV